MNRREENGEARGPVEFELKGKSWTVYLYLLRCRSPVTVRQTQRDLNLSSPSVALHHLEKLKELKLARRTPSNEYKLAGDVKLGVLQNFSRIGTVFMPRMFFYALFFTTMYFFYLGLVQTLLTREVLFLLVLGALACVSFWYETVRMWRQRLF